ncbi:MAG: thioredoxin domain-containing protein [Capsulimonas sp.]|uniref:DsbA family protein n=1 Tax=Capsulimonas sp. TaxID=2494211 RepID=UPI003263BA66
MPNVNKKTILFGSWIVILAGLSYAISRMSSKDVEQQQQKPPPSKFNADVVVKRWPEIMKHVAAPARGPANAAYTIVEFGDFQCPQCGTMRPVVEKGLADSKGQANLYFVHRPIPQIHKFAMASAQASAAAAKDGKFWPMYDVLYSHQDDLEPGYYDKYARAAGLDGAKIMDAVQKNTYLAQINADLAFCEDLGIESTPTVIIRNNKTGEVKVATGAAEIKPMFGYAPWSLTASGPMAPAAKPAKS